MSEQELDMARPISASAVSEYYKEKMGKIGKILNSVSSSTISSIISDKEYEMDNYCSSSTASDSDIEDQNIKRRIRIQPPKINQQIISSNTNLPEQKSQIADMNLYNKLQNINSVSVNNSHDVHFGNKTFFNGPVTIRNIVLKDNNGDRITHTGFKGSLNNVSPERNIDDGGKTQTESNRKVQDDKQIKEFASRIFTKKKIACACGVILLLLGISIALLLTLPLFKDDMNLAKDLEIISRKEWNAIQVNDTIVDLELPLKRVIICHTIIFECDTKEKCITIVREIQDKSQVSYSLKFSDTSYNFLIGGDGNVYEGRGWYKQGAHTSGYNRGSLGIAYIGNFVDKLPNDKQIAAGFRLFAEGLRIGVLDPNYEIYGASQLRNTDSPGGTFLKVIKTWPHAYKGS